MLLALEVSEVSSLSRVRLFANPWAVAHQALPSMGFSRQGYWSGLPFPSPGELPDPGIESGSPALQAGALPSEPPVPTKLSLPWNLGWRVESLHNSIMLCEPQFFSLVKYRQQHDSQGSAEGWHPFTQRKLRACSMQWCSRYLMSSIIFPLLIYPSLCHSSISLCSS